jgi:hypothetical protein
MFSCLSRSRARGECCSSQSDRCYANGECGDTRSSDREVSSASGIEVGAMERERIVVEKEPPKQSLISHTWHLSLAAKPASVILSFATYT